MSKKPVEVSELAKFMPTRPEPKPATQNSIDKTMVIEEPGLARIPTRRRKAEGDFVSLTLRVSRGDWERLHHLAVTERVSLQSLALEGLSRLMTERGLDPMTL